MRKPALLAVLATAALTGILSAAPAAASVTTQKSAYWAGYVAHNAVNTNIDAFKYVTATFTVPSIATGCRTAGYGDVSQLAGLAGDWVPNIDTPLQAAGVYETCTGGTAAYSAAYWDVADNGASDNQPGQADGPTLLFPVSPGDVIFASVYWIAPPPQGCNGGANCQGYENYKVTDKTTGQAWAQKLACNTDNIGNGVSRCDTSTAEVVTQGEPDSSGTPDFGRVHFSQIKVTDVNQTGGKTMVNSQWSTSKVTEYGTVTFRPDVVPSSLANTTNPLESAFTNTWKRLN